MRGAEEERKEGERMIVMARGKWKEGGDLLLPSSNMRIRAHIG